MPRSVKDQPPPVKTYVHHRVTLDELPDDLPQRYVAWLQERKYDCLVVMEKHQMMGAPTRPHLHVSIHTTFSNEHYVKEFRKTFPEVKGQKMQGSHICISQEHNDNYCLKGYKDRITRHIVEPVILYKTDMYTDEYINERHEEFWRVNDNIQANLTPQDISACSVVVIERKKTRAPTWLEKIPEKCIADYPMWEWDASISSKARIYKVVIRELGRAVKCISGRRIREICDGVQNTLAPEDTENEFWSKTYPEEFHRVETGFFRDI